MDEKLRAFAAEQGRAAPYFIMEWNGFHVWDAALTRAALGDEEDEMSIRLSRPDETAAIVGLLPPEECSCEDYEEADFNGGD